MTMLEPAGEAPPFAERFASLLRAHGDEAEVTGGDGEAIVRLPRWGLLDGVVAPPEAFDAWNGLWEGLAEMEDHQLQLTHRRDRGDAAFAWRVSARRPDRRTDVRRVS